MTLIRILQFPHASLTFIRIGLAFDNVITVLREAKSGVIIVEDQAVMPCQRSANGKEFAKSASYVKNALRASNTKGSDELGWRYFKALPTDTDVQRGNCGVAGDVIDVVLVLLRSCHCSETVDDVRRSSQSAESGYPLNGSRTRIENDPNPNH